MGVSPVHFEEKNMGETPTPPRLVLNGAKSHDRD